MFYKMIIVTDTSPAEFELLHIVVNTYTVGEKF